MNPGTAKRYVVLATAGTAGLGVLSSLAVRREFPSARLPIGALAAGIILAIGAEFVPALAGGIAVLMLATAAFVTGPDAWRGISRLFGN